MSRRPARIVLMSERQWQRRRDLRDLAIAISLGLAAGLSGLWWLPLMFGGGTGG
jgi:hypothetical protein